MTLTRNIFEYSQKIMQEKLDSNISEEIKKRVVDSIFVAYGAESSEPVKILKSALLPNKGKYNSRIYFTDTKASIDVSTFINGCMTRYLDYNDTYLSKEALHPSDNIPPILSYSEALELDGEKTIKAIKVAYQVVCALSDAVSIRDHGWDHVTYISISSASGLGGLLDMDERKYIHTLNLAINNNISLRQTRAGELSMWKGCTAGNAARNSVFAAVLAKEGMTGPAPIFEGEMGFFRQVSGVFELDLDKNKIEKTMIKNYPVEYHAMSGVEAALRLKDRIDGEIENIEVETFSVAHKIIVKDPEKLRPKTKETADHSLPYIIAYTLLYSEPNLESYSVRYLTDPKIHEMIDKMEFRVSKRFDSMYPEYLPIKIIIQTNKGKFEEEVTVPKGHFKDPYNWNDLQKKGVSIMKDENIVKEIIEVGKSLEKRNVSELLDVMENVSIEK